MSVNVNWEHIRNIRDKFLQDSDWAVLPDSPLTEEQKQQWIQYRSELRDLPEKYKDSGQPIFPARPM